MTPDIAEQAREIAGKLTKAQREAVHRNRCLTLPMLNHLRDRGVFTADHYLTPLGLAVRAILQENDRA